MSLHDRILAVLTDEPQPTPAIVTLIDGSVNPMITSRNYAGVYKALRDLRERGAVVKHGDGSHWSGGRPVSWSLAVKTDHMAVDSVVLAVDTEPRMADSHGPFG